MSGMLLHQLLTINLAEMKDAGVSSAADALQGKVAGLILSVLPVIRDQDRRL